MSEVSLQVASRDEKYSEMVQVSILSYGSLLSLFPNLLTVLLQSWLISNPSISF